MGILVIFLRFAWPYILGAVILGGLWWGAEHWCNSVCRDARSERDTLVTEKKQAQDRATALALKWAEQVDKTEVAAKTRKATNDATFAVLTNRARSGVPGATVRVLADTVRLFDDASRAANAATAPPVPFAAPDPVSDAAEAHTYRAFDEGELRTFVVTAAQAYSDAVSQWQSCVQFYGSLRLADQLH